MTEETVRYNYRLRPGGDAERYLLTEYSKCRFLWNEAVFQFKSGHKPTFSKLSKLLTEARSSFLWLRQGSQTAQQQTLRTYSQSLNHSFKIKGRGRPKYKKRRFTFPSLQYTTNGFKIKEGRLVLPGKISIPVVWSRELPSVPTSVRVFQDNLGHWYASFVVKREAKEYPEVFSELGIDWGVKVTATTTDPNFDLLHQGFRKRCSAEVAKEQRRMSRRKRTKGLPQSNGYLKAKKSAAKILKKAARQNKDTAEKWANSIVENHSLIAIEDFKPKFLAKSTMAKKAADATIGILKRTLENKADKAGRTVVNVKPAFTTMTCSGCFTRAKEKLSLSQRTFVCENCGLYLDRDLNAARVVLELAKQTLVGHTQVSADDVRQEIFDVEEILQSELRISSL